jgi:hypothetical protein
MITEKELRKLDIKELEQLQYTKISKIISFAKIAKMSVNGEYKGKTNLDLDDLAKMFSEIEELANTAYNAMDISELKRINHSA